MTTQTTPSSNGPTSSPSTLPRLLYYLHTASPLTPTDPADLPKELNGHPVAYFWADGIHTGRYVHPAGHFELLVDRQRLDTWADNFRRMREAGVDVPVPVDHSPSARDNLGYVIDVRRDGDTLRLLHQLIGDDAIKLAARNKVSLGIDPSFSDGRGTPFGDCVVHSSLTPVPIVPGQAGFVPLSAGSAPAIVFHPAPPPSSAQHERHLSLLQRRIEALVAGAHVTPACADRLMELFRSRDRPTARILLSQGADLDAADALLEALSHNRALPLGQLTGLQTLSRPIPGEEPAVDPTIQSKMVRMANGQ